jgi:hypothetical protein
MTWTFTLTETSNGAYSSKGVRDTGNVVSMQSGEDELYRVFLEAYETEVSLGTLPSRALFLVISAAKKNWLTEYNDECFGSWFVNNPTSTERYVYDGRDFLLTYHNESEQPEWQIYLKAKDEATIEIFSSLV